MTRFRAATVATLVRALFACSAWLLGAVGASAEEPQPAAGVVLVASARLVDPLFRHAVVLLCHHGEDGSLGVVMNRPSPHTLKELFPDVGTLRARSPKLFVGGPVATDTLLFLLRGGKGAPKRALPVLGNLYLSADRKLLEKLVEHEQQASDLRVFVGHAGWMPTQLDMEIEAGAWHLIRIDPSGLLERPPEELWSDLNDLLTGRWAHSSGCLVFTPGCFAPG